MKKTIIAFSGKARSGKNTAASWLSSKYGFKEVAFADALKKGCMEIFDLTEEQVYGKLKEVEDPYWKLTPRHILQKVGTDLFREHFDPLIWIKAVEKKIQNGNLFAIVDIRFQNEIEAVRKWGGKIVRLERQVAKASGGIQNHASEFELDSYTDWDYVINNNYDLNFLYKELDKMLKKVV